VLATGWAAVATLTALATSAVLAVPDPRVPPAVDVVVALVAVAVVPLLWTRRAAGAALGLAVLAAVSGAATPAATAAVLVVARWFPVRTALGVALAGAGGHAVQALWRPVGLPLGWWLVCDVAVHAALLGWGAYLQERAVVLSSLRERAWRAEAEQERRIAEARIAERTRIAREMHDTLAHRLSLLAATAGALEYRPDAPPERLAEAAGRVRAGVSGALEDLREVVRLLRASAPDDLGPLPTLDDVPRLVADTAATGASVEYERRGDADPPSAVAVAAYRAVQEGLTNARRHAEGADVRVVVDSRPGELRVVVSDDGGRPNADPALAGSGTGLVGLRERVSLLGGRLDAAPLHRGFVLDVRIPWQ
jgi:signal transduction histidine kinase